MAASTSSSSAVQFLPAKSFAGPSNGQFEPSDRQCRMQRLRNELKAIVRNVRDRFEVSTKDDESILGESGMFFECKPPKSWLSDDSDYDSDADDVDSADHSDPNASIWLFVEAGVLLAANCRVKNNTACTHPAVTEFFGKATAFIETKQNEALDNENDIPPQFSADVKDYDFEAVACLVNEYLISADQTSDDDDISSSHGDEQEAEVLSFLEAFKYGRDSRPPEDADSYNSFLGRHLRLYPRTSEAVYELARTCGRRELECKSKVAMFLAVLHAKPAQLWQWGVESRRMPWIIPCFTWIYSKLAMNAALAAEMRCAPNAAVQNFLLILLEKKFCSMNEALALYDAVMLQSPSIAAMYIERELITAHLQHADALEFLLSEIDACEASKNKPKYTRTLANAVLLRAACTLDGAAVLRNPLRGANKPTRNRKFRERCWSTYDERYRRMLLIAGLKARFTLELSHDGVVSAELLEMLLIRRRSIKSVNLGSNADVVPPPSSITFTCYLRQSSTDFGIQLARALGIIAHINLLADEEVISDVDCMHINWNYVQIRQTAASGSIYARAAEFQSLPFVYMPSNVAFCMQQLQTFRRACMPLEHPMASMLMHALYDNDDGNLLSGDDEDRLSALQKQQNNRPSRSRAGTGLRRRYNNNNNNKADGGDNSDEKNKERLGSNSSAMLHYQLRLTAKDLRQLFSRRWKWQHEEGETQADNCEEASSDSN